jgi:hypothetical protein
MSASPTGLDLRSAAMWLIGEKEAIGKEIANELAGDIRSEEPRFLS